MGIVRAIECFENVFGAIISCIKHRKGILDMPYESVSLEESIHIRKLYSVHYFQYMSDFSFPGESHNFWEFIYVDSGTVNVTAGRRRLTLNRGNILFHKPNEFHSVHANGVVSPSLVVVSFSCHSACMNAFKGQLLTLQNSEHELLADLIREAQHAFNGRMDDPYLQHLVVADSSLAFGAEQLIYSYLEQLLIQLYRRNFISRLPGGVDIPVPENTGKTSEVYTRIVQYMEAHVREHLTMDQLCGDNILSRSTVQKIMKETCGCGAIEFFSHLKIETAKQLIRDNKMSITEIADYLGYTSIHYFSRQFRHLTFMSPSEYANSIKSLSDRPV